jgi:hypothetical protein
MLRRAWRAPMSCRDWSSGEGASQPRLVYGESLTHADMGRDRQRKRGWIDELPPTERAQSPSTTEFIDAAPYRSRGALRSLLHRRNVRSEPDPALLCSTTLAFHHLRAVIGVVHESGRASVDPSCARPLGHEGRASHPRATSTGNRKPSGWEFRAGFADVPARPAMCALRQAPEQRHSPHRGQEIASRRRRPQCWQLLNGDIVPPRNVDAQMPQMRCRDYGPSVAHSKRKYRAMPAFPSRSTRPSRADSGHGWCVRARRRR